MQAKDINKGNNNKKMTTANILKVKKLDTHWVQTGFFECGGVGSGEWGGEWGVGWRHEQ